MILEKYAVIYVTIDTRVQLKGDLSWQRKIMKRM
jgi:hypothetical protein